MTETTKRCPKCGSATGHCPECGRTYEHGTASHCEEEACRKVNAPIDCECGYVVSADLRGVLNLDMQLLPWR